jgi:hypothetical protein
MSSRPGRSLAAFLLAITGLFASTTGEAQAHPRLVGVWIGQNPPNTLMKYELGPGEYQGNWVWRGPLTFYVDNIAISTGTYELRLSSGLDGSLELRDGNGLPNASGIIDLGRRVLTFKDVIFRPQERKGD